MQTTSHRVRLAPTFEWMVAVAFLAATILVALLLVRELMSAPAGVPVPLSSEPTAAAQPAIPERSIPVPSLLLPDGVQVKVGDSLELVQRSLGSAAEVGSVVTESGPLGPRTIRTYERQGTRFLLVFEPFERKGPPRVAGIYLQ